MEYKGREVDYSVINFRTEIEGRIQQLCEAYAGGAFQTKRALYLEIRKLAEALQKGSRRMAFFMAGMVFKMQTEHDATPEEVAQFAVACERVVDLFDFERSGGVTKMTLKVGQSVPPELRDFLGASVLQI